MRIRMERAITEKIVDTQRRAASERKETREALDGLNTEVTTVTREIVQELDAVIADVRTELARLDLAELDDKAIVDKRQGMELKLVAVADRNLEALTSITEDLRALHWARDDDGRFIGMNLMNESIQEDLLAMRERSEGGSRTHSARDGT